jgi:hypothetical protein
MPTLITRDGQPYDLDAPESAYDETRIFRWSHPARNVDGSYPLPWRVSDFDALEALVRDLGYSHADAYVTYCRPVRRFESLCVGLRDNRNREAHKARTAELALALERRGCVVELRDGYVAVVDDIARGHLRK